MAASRVEILNDGGMSRLTLFFSPTHFLFAQNQASDKMPAVHTNSDPHPSSYPRTLLLMARLLPRKASPL